MQRIADHIEYARYIAKVLGLADGVYPITGLLDKYGRPKEYPCLVGFVRLPPAAGAAPNAFEYDFSFTYRDDILACLAMIDGSPGDC